MKRMRWYDVILHLTMMIEVFYRGFEDKGQYFWAKEMLEKSMQVLQKIRRQRLWQWDQEE